MLTVGGHGEHISDHAEAPQPPFHQPAIAAFCAAWAALFAFRWTGRAWRSSSRFRCCWRFCCLLRTKLPAISAQDGICRILAALVILSRLDTVLLLALYFAALMRERAASLLLRRVPWICLGLVPVFVYARPISGFLEVWARCRAAQSIFSRSISSARRRWRVVVLSARPGCDGVSDSCDVLIVAGFASAWTTAGSPRFSGRCWRSPHLSVGIVVFKRLGPVDLVSLSIYRVGIGGLLLLRVALLDWSWTQVRLCGRGICALRIVLRGTPQDTRE